MINKKRNFLLIGIFTMLLFSCDSKQHPEVPVAFQRYDEAIFSQNIDELISKYPDFTPLYFKKIIEIGEPTAATTASYLEEFRKTYKKTVYDSVQLVFSTMHPIEKELGKALGNYKFLFLKDTLPEFYTHFSGFNQAIISNGNIISVSLENYLGNSSFYDELGVYQYLREGMYPNKIPRDIIKMLLLKEIELERTDYNLLAKMIYQGKIYYALQQIFPRKDLSFLLNYNTKQGTWCQNNEANMWHFIIENKHLFTTDYRIIRSYIDPAPFTKGFPNESPGQTGIWLGYQIVKNYVANSKTPLSDLIKETDYKKILKQAAYNPE